jgi:hypothetical protein
MSSLLQNISFDAHDAYAQAGFWGQVLRDFDPDPDNPDAPGDEECGLVGPDGRTCLLFLEVPEAKTVKNRVHLCLTPADVTRDEEVERLLSIGATMFDDRRNEDGTGWAVLADPEGNEFCVLRSDAERAQSAPQA